MGCVPRNPQTFRVRTCFMASLITPLDRVNGMLRLGGLPFRIRERAHSSWLSVYEVLPGGGTKERAVRG
jgi:hypothetical protein